MSDPSLPVQVGAALPFGDTAADYMEFASEGVGLLAANNRRPGLVSFDTTDPANLAVLDTLGLWTAHTIATLEGFAYLGSFHEGLVVVDVHDLSDLTEVGRIGTIFPQDLLIVDEVLYAAEPGVGLHVLDLNDRENPQPITLINTFVVNPYALAHAAPYLYVGDFDLGGVVVSLADPRGSNRRGSSDPGMMVATATTLLMTRNTGDSACGTSPIRRRPSWRAPHPVPTTSRAAS